LELETLVPSREAAAKDAVIARKVKKGSLVFEVENRSWTSGLMTLHDNNVVMLYYFAALVSLTLDTENPEP
jgi:hypothetical protein